MTFAQRQNLIATVFILLSLLLHLLVLLIPMDKLFPEESTSEPVYVEVRPPIRQERELDLPIRKELEKPRKKPAKRLAERDQVVEKEMAPEGRDTEDLPQKPRPPQPVTRAPELRPEPRAEEQVKKPQPELALPVTPDGWKSRTDDKPGQKVPDLQTLTQISADTLEQIETDWRRKYRDDIARGDTVWMDSQQDLLNSFMRRFRTNVYNVWNYPAEAAQREQQGTCLLRVTVNRLGNVTDVVLLESSGYKILDEEAMDAVRQGATYGPLPRAYPNEDLKIMAFFQYRLGGIARAYRQRPGEIY